jgi:hypothetical protein
MLLARLYEAFPLACPVCRAQMRGSAFVTDRASITRILEPLGEPTRPPPVSPARGPPGWEGMLDQTPVCDPTAPVPGRRHEPPVLPAGHRVHAQQEARQLHRERATPFIAVG